MKKPVSSSHLALRFYKADGWTRTCLIKYLKQGEILDTAFTHGDQAVHAYLYMSPESKMDMRALLENEVSKVIRWYGGDPKETDLEYLESMNW